MAVPEAGPESHLSPNFCFSWDSVHFTMKYLKNIPVIACMTRGRRKRDYNTSICIGYRHVPRSQKDPGSWISRIQDPGCWRILDRIFLFSHGVLEILDPVTTLPWDPRDLGSLRENILLDPGDPRCQSARLTQFALRRFCRWGDAVSFRDIVRHKYSINNL